MSKRQMKTIRNTNPHEVRSQEERRWHRRMKIWHAFNNYPLGLKGYEIAKITGINTAQVYPELESIPGVRYEIKPNCRLWFAV